MNKSFIMQSLTALNADILSWAVTELLPWQHFALRTLISKPELTAHDLSLFYERALFDYGITNQSEHQNPISLSLNELPTGEIFDHTLCLDSLQNIENIGLLHSSSVLRFNPHCTIIIGTESSGKSTFVRLFKKACKCRQSAQELLLPDISLKQWTSKTPSAIFTLQYKNSIQKVQWKNGTVSDPRLCAFAVFDDKVMQSLFQPAQHYQFSPASLQIFQKLADVTQSIKIKLLNFSQTNLPDTTILEKVQTNTHYYRQALQTIMEADHLKFIEISSWDSDLQDSLQEKQRTLSLCDNASLSQKISHLQEQIQWFTEVKTHMAHLSGILTDHKCETLITAIRDYEHCLESLATRTTVTFEDIKVQGIGSVAWEELLRAAMKFSSTEAYPGKEFPPTKPDARCVLCHQPLSLDAFLRLTRLWRLIESDSNKKRDAAKMNMEELKRQFQELEIHTHLYKNKPACFNVPESMELPEKIDAWFSSAEQRKDLVNLSSIKSNKRFVPAWDASLIHTITEKITSLTQQLQHIQTSEIDDNDKIQLLQREYDELEARKKLYDNQNAILEFIHNLRQARGIRTSAESISTEKIIQKIHNLQRKYIYNEVRHVFKQNLSILGIAQPIIDIEPVWIENEFLFKAMVTKAYNTQAMPHHILSDSEKMAYGLCWFLAESSDPDLTKGIILDDPTALFDDHAKQMCIQLLTSHAQQKQIILFTRDKKFARSLSESLKQQNLECSLLTIEKQGNSTGIVTPFCSEE